MASGERVWGAGVGDLPAQASAAAGVLPGESAAGAGAEAGGGGGSRGGQKTGFVAQVGVCTEDNGS